MALPRRGSKLSRSGSCARPPSAIRLVGDEDEAGPRCGPAVMCLSRVVPRRASPTDSPQSTGRQAYDELQSTPSESEAGARDTGRG